MKVVILYDPDEKKIEENHSKIHNEVVDLMYKNDVTKIEVISGRRLY